MRFDYIEERVVQVGIQSEIRIGAAPTHQLPPQTFYT